MSGATNAQIRYVPLVAVGPLSTHIRIARSLSIEPEAIIFCVGCVLDDVLSKGLWQCFFSILTATATTTSVMRKL